MKDFGPTAPQAIGIGQSVRDIYGREVTVTFANALAVFATMRP